MAAAKKPSPFPGYNGPYPKARPSLSPPPIRSSPPLLENRAVSEPLGPSSLSLHPFQTCLKNPATFFSPFISSLKEGKLTCGPASQPVLPLQRPPPSWRAAKIAFGLAGAPLFFLWTVPFFFRGSGLSAKTSASEATSFFLPYLTSFHKLGILRAVASFSSFCECFSSPCD